MRTPTLIAGLLETLLAKLLTFHPDPRPLAQWQGQVVRIQFNELPFPLYLILTDPIQIYSQYDGDAQSEVSLSLDVLVRLNDGSNLSTLVNEGQLDIEGDMQLVGKLLNLLSAIEPDLAEPLSAVVGDAMAYRIDQGGRALFNKAKQDLGRLKSHGIEFIQEELRLLPNRQELTWFGDEVEQLAARTAKLEQRLAARKADS